MIHVYNTLSRKLETFEPINKDQVTFYSCGPTVYWYQHIGNMRAAIANDIFKRTLTYFGYNVKHISNITDVGHLVSDGDEGEDKMVKGIKREGLDLTAESMLKLADKYAQVYWDDIAKLNVIPPEKWTKATEHVEDIVRLVQGLIDKGFVYETSTSFYFDTSKLPDYGKLANLQKENIEAGARVEVDPEKKNPTDFAVWMKAVGDNEKHVMLWETPFSDVKGFPGWHIECSAMSMKYLGDSIDIHSGGVEHIGVHHPNEIAQSEAFTCKPFVKYWLHYEHLILKAGKMSKSGGTTILLQDLIDKGYDPLALRYLALQVHYRTILTFSYEALDDAQNGLSNIRERFLSLGDDTGSVHELYKKEFSEALEDDFNTSKALAVFHAVLKDSELKATDKRATLLDMDSVFGLGLVTLQKEEVAVPEEIRKRADERLEAKKNKDFDLADKLRNEIHELGWVIEDTPDGYNLKKD